MLPGVGEAEWVFKTSFKVDGAELSQANVDLVFEGLDTYATVKLVSLSAMQAQQTQIYLPRTG